MTADEIRRLFAPNWVFRLYLQKRISYAILVVAIPAVIWLCGAVVAFLLGEFRLFASNVLAYSGLALISIALAAYGWFARVFPDALEALYPALDCEAEQYMGSIAKWANRLANHLWIMFLLGSPFAVFNLLDLLTLWRSINTPWLGTAWVQSNHPLFYAVYYGFYNVFATDFLLGSGIAGILGEILLVRAVLINPLYLDLYRRLRIITGVSVGVALWTLVPFAATLVASIFLKPVTTATTVSSIVQSMIASTVLLAAFFLPVFLAGSSIVRAKSVRIAKYEGILKSTNECLEQLLVASEPWSDVSKGTEIEEQRDRLRKSRDCIELDIQRVESISDWPISLVGLLSLGGAATSPLWSAFASTLVARFLP